MREATFLIRIFSCDVNAFVYQNAESAAAGGGRNFPGRPTELDDAGANRHYETVRSPALRDAWNASR